MQCMVLSGVRCVLLAWWLVVITTMAQSLLAQEGGLKKERKALASELSQETKIRVQLEKWLQVSQAQDVKQQKEVRKIASELRKPVRPRRSKEEARSNSDRTVKLTWDQIDVGDRASRPKPIFIQPENKLAAVLNFGDKRKLSGERIEHSQRTVRQSPAREDSSCRSTSMTCEESAAP